MSGDIDIVERLRLYAAAEAIHAPLNGGGFLRSDQCRGLWLASERDGRVGGGVHRLGGPPWLR